MNEYESNLRVFSWVRKRLVGPLLIFRVGYKGKTLGVE